LKITGTLFIPILIALFVFPHNQFYPDIGSQKEYKGANLQEGYAAIGEQIIFMFAYREPVRSQIITPVSPGPIENKPYKQQRINHKETTDKNTGQIFHAKYLFIFIHN
jgi:hypothetical protein